MPNVEHQKWWGWGVDGVAFTPEGKPAFTPYVQGAIGIDLDTHPAVDPPDFADLEVPASRLPADLGTALRGAVGDHNVVLEDLDRVVHTYGKGMRDLVWVRAGYLPRVPDAVVYPANEDEVQQVVDTVAAADAVLIPFGGGSNISGSLTPSPQEERPVISLDMGRMNRVLELDEASNLAHVQAGVLGPDLERQLNAQGWTLGHQPDSFKHSTLGGWIATRSSGMQSDKYGDIGDITRGLTSILPGKRIELRPLPSTSTGPSVLQMVVGSEGRLGVITSAWVGVHPLPENREVVAYLFPNWAAGVRAMFQLTNSDASPTITRVSDANETSFSLATRRESNSVSSKVGEALFAFLERRGWDLEKVCISYIGYEGGAGKIRSDKAIVGKVVSAVGGIKLGKGPGAMYDDKKFDTPYLRDFLLDRGAVGDVSETAVPWDKLGEMHFRVTRAAEAVFAQLGVQGFMMCHLSHSYRIGACLYFTFSFVPNGDFLTQYHQVKSAIQQTFIEVGGTLSHHHGVGADHAPWMPADVSTAGTELIAALFAAADPGRNLNPNTLLPQDAQSLLSAQAPTKADQPG